MVSSSAGTVDQYLQELPTERREVVERMRELILENLPEGYVESIGWGMISYEIPLARYPDSYNGQPLAYAALAAQKNHYALYLMGAYADPAQHELLTEEFRKAGKKMDMGKSCLRFKRLADLPLEAVGEVIASTPPERFIELYEQGRAK